MGVGSEALPCCASLVDADIFSSHGLTGLGMLQTT